MPSQRDLLELQRLRLRIQQLQLRNQLLRDQLAGRAAANRPNRLVAQRAATRRQLASYGQLPAGPEVTRLPVSTANAHSQLRLIPNFVENLEIVTSTSRGSSDYLDAMLGFAGMGSRQDQFLWLTARDRESSIFAYSYESSEIPGHIVRFASRYANLAGQGRLRRSPGRRAVQAFGETLISPRYSMLEIATMQMCYMQAVTPDEWTRYLRSLV